MKWHGLDGLVKTELAPYVICVVVDRAQQSRTASYKQPVTEDVWEQCCDWGIAAQKDPHTLPRLKPLPAGLWFPHAKPQVEEQCVAPLEYSFYCCVHAVRLSDHAGPIRKETGQSAGTDEFWMCWRWFIIALKILHSQLTLWKTPVWDDRVLTNHGTVTKSEGFFFSHLYIIILNILCIVCSCCVWLQWGYNQCGWCLAFCMIKILLDCS